MNQTQSPDSQPAYVLSLAHGTPQEIDRLDDLHEAIKFYLGGKLSLAPLEESPPRSILEMGSGSGAWAIQAAERFPEADVLAVDLAPLPSRPLPPNIRFQILDMTKPFPFECQTFDIVHARFVLTHLPRFEEVLNRMMELVTPGGWLLLEEFETLSAEDARLGPGQKAFWTQFYQYAEGKNMNLRAGLALQGILKSSPLFSEVNVKTVAVSMSKKGNPHIDLPLRRVGEALRRTVSQVMPAIREKINLRNSEVLEAAEEELNDPNLDMEIDLFLTWSRRRE